MDSAVGIVTIICKILGIGTSIVVKFMCWRISERCKPRIHNFFFAPQADDDDGRAASFFWVDARSQMVYQYFGDVVSFDTTYRTII